MSKLLKPITVVENWLEKIEKYRIGFIKQSPVADQYFIKSIKKGK